MPPLTATQTLPLQREKTDKKPKGIGARIAQGPMKPIKAKPFTPREPLEEEPDMFHPSGETMPKKFGGFMRMTQE